MSRIGDFFRGLFGYPKPHRPVTEEELRELHVSFNENGWPVPEACPHGGVDDPLTIIVHGRKTELASSRQCRECITRTFNRLFTRCAACGELIVPGIPVARSWFGAKFPYTHLIGECCECGGLYCGQWGPGGLITLHELNPEKYPEGATSLLDAVMMTGRPIEERF